ncbi:unnamed protein product (mitochondrion) [Plasmodiophora brassicae]|uniref:DNA repair protein RAD50 n=1 Tax=Plasmodiophora brassicae TaxID=37360 RepID=A0A3P3YMS8_PLABS|nr:unnamed protein product [Plasmodiophora brassicae]
MTTLHKLSVRGVRSYSPDDESVIKFQHPLTIIVGSNGSGKTTIIECLKYVCSGEFPPLSDKGKSFVHDPDACGEPVVKGQIKLAFRTAAGASVIACKSFQVTAQKGRRTFKLIDSVLSTTDESGATKTCSYKCARMDELMTTLMGVSQPILENVIFCHQLDADWPLSDDKSLKKRFDDIFAATKYTKALENIKKLRAEQTAKVKDMQRDLDILSSNLQTARKIEDDIKQTTSKLESVSAKWTGAKDAKECHTELVERLSGELAQVSSAEANLQSLEREASLMAQEVARARSTLQLEYVEDDDALRTRLAQLEKALEQRSRSVAPCEAELQAATAHEETLSSEYQNAIKAVGRIEVLQEQFDAQMRAARDRMLALSDTYGLGQHVDLSSSRSPLEQAQAFIDALTHVESTLVGECTSAKEAAGRRVGDLERRVNRCAEALSDAVQQERVEQREREHIEKAIADLDVELAVARRQTVALEPLRAQLREAERALQDHVAQVAALDVDKQLECLTRQQSSLMPRIDAAVTRIQTLQRAADARSAVSVQERLLDQARRRASEARAKCPPMDGLSAQDMADRLAREHAEARAASDRARANVHSAQESKSLLHGRRQALQAQVADAEQRARDLRARVDAHRVSSRAHLDELVAARTAEQARHEQTVRYARDYAQMFADWGDDARAALQDHAAQAQHACGLCARPFTPAELRAFVDGNDARIAKLRNPEETAAAEAALARLRSQLEKLGALRGVFDDLERVERDDLPALRSQLAALDADIADAEARLADATQGADSADARLRSLDEAQRLVATLVDAERDVESCAQRVADLTRSQTEGAAEPGSVEDAHAAYEAMQNESKDVSRRMDDLRALALQNDNGTRERTDACTRLRERALELGRVEERVAASERELSALRDRLAQSQATTADLKRAQGPLDDDLRQARQRLDEERERSSRAVSDLDGRVRRIQQDVRELRQCLGDLRRIGNDLDAQRRIERGTTQLEADVRSARDAVRAAQHRLDTVRAALAQFEVDHRNLSDNVAYRARCAQLEDLHGRVRSLRAQASSARPSSVVQADLDQARQALLQSERDCASCSGAHATLADQLSNSKAMLHEERYRTAAARHRDVTIDLETTRLAVADLDCFYKALDRSLMEFHSIKMREINDVLKDLWQATYRGKDIDTIAIRSDSADGVADVGGPRKQYNYRLVMMQGDTELGMRGRSSAGQRVLASLLIRMALSETFCVRCGILALDEPTTNLDEENVRALADALNALIERRKGHESFQLIVITHDEEFVELLRKRDHADCYWRVFKDTNGCSKIKKIPINA